MKRKAYILSYDNDKEKIKILEVIAFDTPNEAQLEIWKIVERLKSLGGEESGSEGNLGSITSDKVQDTGSSTDEGKGEPCRVGEGHEEGSSIPCEQVGEVGNSKLQVYDVAESQSKRKIDPNDGVN